MTNINYNLEVDEQIIKNADILFRSMGMTLSSAINLFLEQSVIQSKLPIEIKPDPVYAYGEELLRDMEESDKKIAEGTAKFYTPEELFAEWDEEFKSDI